MERKKSPKSLKRQHSPKFIDASGKLVNKNRGTTVVSGMTASKPQLEQYAQLRQSQLTSLY